jgi:hypothetical protein
MRRKGVILLITVAFITAIMALIGYQFSLVDNGLKRTGKEAFDYQSALLLHDVQKILIPQMLVAVSGSDVNSSVVKEIIGDTLSAWYNIPTPLISDPVIGSATVTLRPSASGFDINRFKTFPPDQRGFFEFFAQELADRNLLMDLIDLALETNASVNATYAYLVNDNDLPLNDPFFHRGLIADPAQFRIIQDAYFAKTKDKKIYTLPWENFLDFDSGGSPNFSFMGYEYCRAVFFERPPTWHDTYCRNEEGLVYDYEEAGFYPDDLNASPIKEHAIIFSPYSRNILVEVDFVQDFHEGRFRFMYDIEAKKALWTEAEL